MDQLPKWEMEKLDWSLKGFDEETVTPDDVLKLFCAKNEDDADAYCSNLEFKISKNNVAYGAAYPAFQMILAALPRLTGFARSSSLQALETVLYCESHETAPGVVENCLAELKLAAWYLFHGIQFDEPENIWLYYDLIGLLGDDYPDIREKAEFYLTCVLEREIPESAWLSREAVDEIRDRIANDRLWPIDDDEKQ